MKKAGTYKAAKDLVDFDYLNKLSPKERAWLKKFRDEYYYDKLTDPPPLHKKTKQKKELHGLNDSRRRDIWNNHTRVEGDPENLEERDDGTEE